MQHVSMRVDRVESLNGLIMLVTAVHFKIVYNYAGTNIAMHRIKYAHVQQVSKFVHMRSLIAKVEN